jgi:hypothetical protein
MANALCQLRPKRRRHGRLRRLLGLHPGPDLATSAAASLAGVPPGTIRPLLAELTRAHLITEHIPGRFAFHDLLRAYTTELVHGHDTDADRHDAIHRVLDHYLHSAHSATRLVEMYGDPIILNPGHPGVTTEDAVTARRRWPGSSLNTLCCSAPST